jgi:hypothetical protein
VSFQEPLPQAGITCAGVYSMCFRELPIAQEHGSRPEGLECSYPGKSWRYVICSRTDEESQTPHDIRALRVDELELNAGYRKFIVAMNVIGILCAVPDPLGLAPARLGKAGTPEPVLALGLCWRSQLLWRFHYVGAMGPILALFLRWRPHCAGVLPALGFTVAS